MAPILGNGSHTISDKVATCCMVSDDVLQCQRKNV
jgi:hypothetical protein